MLDPIPVPLVAGVNTSHTEITVTFSGPVFFTGDPSTDITARHDDVDYFGLGTSSLGSNVIVFDVGPTGADVGVDHLLYTAVSELIRDHKDRLIAAFDIPLLPPGIVPVAIVYDISDAEIDIVFGEAVTLNDTIKQNFAAYANGAILTLGPLSLSSPNVVTLGVVVDGPSSQPDSLVYTQPVNGMAGVDTASR